jgi:hypothetical protein
MRRYGTRMTSVVVNVDVGPFMRALAAMAKSTARSLDNMAQAVRRMGTAFARAHEVQVCGLEARVYVRVAMAISTEEDLHSLIRLLLRKPSAALGLGDSLFLTRADRARLAASACRAWAEHHSASTDEHSPLPWHRYMAGTRVLVS